jgi:subtilisin family serine protease
MVAGVVGAVTDNGLGIAGTSPEVSLLALKFARESKGLVADAAEAIRYAVLEGASVVNASFSTEGDDLHLRAALELANEAGVLVVAAAATDDGTAKDLDDFGGYPCVYDLPNVLCVTVANEDHALASSWGATTVDLAAPGVNIRSTFLSPEYRKQVSASTSLAAPFVSGVAALILSRCQVSLAELRAGLLAGLPLSQPAGQQIASGKRLNASLALATSCGEGPSPPQLLEP